MFQVSKREESWQELVDVLKYGFYRVNGNQFEGPSYRKFLNQDSALIVLGKKVKIFKDPSLESKILLLASYEKFDCDCYVVSANEKSFQRIQGYDWQQIKLKDGSKAYVLYNFTSEKIQRELSVKKIKGQWQIFSFFMPPGC